MKILTVISIAVIYELCIANRSPGICLQYEKYINIVGHLIEILLHEGVNNLKHEHLKKSLKEGFNFIDEWYHKSETSESLTCTDTETSHPVGTWHLVDLQRMSSCRLTVRAGPRYFILINFIIFHLEAITDDDATTPCENNNHLVIVKGSTEQEVLDQMMRYGMSIVGYFLPSLLQFLQVMASSKQ